LSWPCARSCLHHAWVWSFFLPKVQFMRQCMEIEDGAGARNRQAEGKLVASSFWERSTTRLSTSAGTAAASFAPTPMPGGNDPCESSQFDSVSVLTPRAKDPFPPFFLNSLIRFLWRSEREILKTSLLLIKQSKRYLHAITTSLVMQGASTSSSTSSVVAQGATNS
jgi:hypothetical protein